MRNRIDHIFIFYWIDRATVNVSRKSKERRYKPGMASMSRLERYVNDNNVKTLNTFGITFNAIGIYLPPF